MKRFLALFFALSFVVALAGTAMAAAEVDFGEGPNLEEISIDTFAKEAVYTCPDIEEGSCRLEEEFSFELDETGTFKATAVGNPIIGTVLQNGTFAEKQQGPDEDLNLYLFFLTDATHARVAGILAEGGEDTSFANFVVTTTFDLQNKVLFLGYYDGAELAQDQIVLLADIDQKIELFPNAGLASGGTVSFGISSLQSALGTVIPVRAPTSAVYFQAVTTLALKTNEGTDTIDVNFEREQFVGGEEESDSMAFWLSNEVIPDQCKLDTELIEDGEFEVTLKLTTDNWDGIERISCDDDDENDDDCSLEISFETDNGSIKGEGHFDGETFTYTVTDPAAIAALFGSNEDNPVHVEITVDGETVLQARSFYIAVDIHAECYGDRDFGPAHLGDWDVNGFQAVIPFIGNKLDPNFKVNIILNNMSDQEGQVFFDVVATDDPSVDVSDYSNITVPGKDEIPAHGNLAVMNNELVPTIGLPESVSRFSVRVTLTIPTSQGDVFVLKWHAGEILNEPVFKSNVPSYLMN